MLTAWLSRSVPWPARSGSRQLHTFCFGYAAGELVVDPLLHDVAPTVFAE
jgi:hypothetical protein